MQNMCVHVLCSYWHGEVAVKILNVTNPSIEQLNEFYREASILKKLRHPNVLSFMGLVRATGCHTELAIVTEWCTGKSLYQRIHVIDDKMDRRWLVMDLVKDLVKDHQVDNDCISQMTWFQVENIAHQTALALDYLHSKLIIHRDLKSNSIPLMSSHTEFLLPPPQTRENPLTENLELGNKFGKNQIIRLRNPCNVYFSHFLSFWQKL